MFLQNLSSIFGRPRSVDIMLFCRQLEVMLSAGLPLRKALTVFLDQLGGNPLRTHVLKMVQDIDGGKTFSEAMQNTGVFSQFIVSMVRVAENGAELDKIMGKAAYHLEARAKITAKVISSLAYPVVVVCIAVFVVIALMTFVIPTFSSMFIDLGKELPYSSKMVIFLSDFTLSHFPEIILAVFSLCVAFVYLYGLSFARLRIDKMLLSLPIVGAIVQKSSVGRFCSTLGTLTASGIPLIESMQITSATTGNSAIEHAIRASIPGIASGGSLAKLLKETKLFPPMVIQMIAVGEETGRLPAMLDKIADFHDADVAASAERLTSILEPVLILALGVVVAALLVAMYLPLFDMIGNVQ